MASVLLLPVSHAVVKLLSHAYNCLSMDFMVACYVPIVSACIRQLYCVLVQVALSTGILLHLV